MSPDGPDRILPFIGDAARAAREERGRLQVHIAATRGVTQEAVGRFERGLQWPRDPDALLAAYAEDLDIDVVDIWDRAVATWRASR